MTESQATLIRDIQNWAHDNYESYGASSIIECFEDEEILEEFSSLADAQDYAALMDEMYSNAQDY